MANIGIRRYSKLITVYNKINSLKDDFEGERDIIEFSGDVSVHYKLELISATLKHIIDEC